MSNETSTRGIGSLSNNVFERRTSTGSGLFSFFDGGFAQSFSQIASITVKKLRNTNFISSRHVERENTSLPVDVRRSKTLLLKLPNVSAETYMSLCGRKIWFAHAQESKDDLKCESNHYPCNCEPLSKIGRLSLINFELTLQFQPFP